MTKRLELLSLKGVWAANAAYVERVVQQAFDIVDLTGEFANSAPITMVGDVAVIPISGTMVKGASWWGYNTQDLRASLRDAVANKKVAGIVLDVDSPGGSVDGMAALVDDLQDARRAKPVVAYVEDTAASAAYWAASQADKIIAGRSADLGSIGVYATVVDSSQRAEKMGLKVHVIKSAPGKAAGAPGTEITEEQLAELQAMVDRSHEDFVASVANGRRMTMERADSLATGKLYSARDAVANGLADSIGRMSDAIDTARQLANARRANESMRFF